MNTNIENYAAKISRDTALNEMIKYLYMTTCRRRFILDYFEDRSSGFINKCCDNCHNAEKHLAVDIAEEASAILKLVSQSRTNYGKQMYVKVLRGSKSKGIPAFFAESPQFGSFKHKSKKWLDFCLRQLIIQKFLEETPIPGSRFGTVLALTFTGQDFCFATQPSLMIHVPTELQPPAPLPPQIPMLPQTADLPTTTTPATTTTTPATATTTTTPATAKKSSNVLGATHEQTYTLLREGNSIDDIAKKRDLKKQTIEAHIVKCYESNLEINFEDYVSTEDYELVTGIINGQMEGKVDKLAPIKSLCPSHISYLKIKMVIAKMAKLAGSADS